VVLAPFSHEVLQRLLSDPSALGDLGPEQFQHFIAHRLECIGLEPKVVGHVFRKDGGIDIVAYPRILTVPFLLGVQVKHHRSGSKTGVRDVRDFHGTLTANHSPFQLGIIATNTTFTPDARWFAEHNQRIMRMRDMSDLQRWLRHDFMNDCEWREIPEMIQLAPGIIVDIPRPTQRVQRYP
jgi:hypothetical protein